MNKHLILRLGPLLRPGHVFHFAEVTPENHPIRLHGHDFIEIFWVIAGRGVEQRPDGPRPLCAGDYGLVTRSEIHGLENRDGLRFCNVALFAAHWVKLRRRYGGALTDRFGHGASRRRGRLPAALAQRLDQAADPMRRGRRDALTLDRFLLELDATLEEAARGDGLPPWLAAALRRDEVRFGGVADLAAAAGCSREHLARVCRDVLQQTPTQLLTHARLDHAAALLERSRRPVLEVALDSGFSNLGHFHARFKQRFGRTPLKYRQHQQAVAMPT